MSAASADVGARLRLSALALAVAGALLLALDAAFAKAAWAPSYLAVWLFVMGLSAGSVSLCSLQRLTGGRWGVPLRPFLDAALALLPVVLLLAVPLLFKMNELYAWMRGSVSPDQRWYLNPAFFYLRAALYFAIWLTLAWLLYGEPRASRYRLRRWAAARGMALPAVCFLLNALVMTFASFDWIMSLTPPWRSTIFGMVMGTAQTMAALAAAIVAAAAIAGPRQESARFHDLGTLLFALVLLWAYLEFMQYLITWSEDLPDEVVWFVPRTQTSWLGLTLFVAAAFFALPCVALLSRFIKRRPAVLAAVAGVVLIGRIADSFWLVLPTFAPGGLRMDWSALFALAAVGGTWLWVLLRALAASPGAGQAVLERGAGGHGG